MEAATQSLKFLGNAYSNISERRKKIVTNLNKDLHPLVEEPERYSKAAPYLFRRDFERSAREHVESVHSLRKLNAPPASSRQGQFFRQGCPHQAARGRPLQRKQQRQRKRPLQAIPEPGELLAKRSDSKVEPLTWPLGTVAETTSVFPNLPLVMFSLGCTQSSAMQLLQNRGVTGHSKMYGFSQTPSSRASKSLPAQLAGNHSRQVGAEDRAGAQDRIPEASLSKEQTTPIVLHREGRGVHASRDPKHAKQTGHISGRGDRQEYLLPDVPGPQKRRQAETWNKSKKTQPVCEDRAIQYGGHSHAERL